MSAAPIRYNCIGCDQRVSTIGGYSGTLRAFKCLTIAFCKPCHGRMLNNSGFQQIVDERAALVSGYAYIEALANQLGVSPGDFKKAYFELSHPGEEYEKLAIALNLPIEQVARAFQTVMEGLL